jgi:hypothetical protein
MATNCRTFEDDIHKGHFTKKSPGILVSENDSGEDHLPEFEPDDSALHFDQDQSGFPETLSPGIIA